MKTSISTREWEALSAYMDGQLNPTERTRLEIQLKENENLRKALDDLRRTRAVLRAAPRHRAPRNFTLSASMVAMPRSAPKGFSLFSTLRLASAVASFLFILVLVGDFWMTSWLRQPAALEAAQAPLEQAQVEMAQEAAPEAAMKSTAPDAAADTQIVEEPAILMAPSTQLGTPYPEPTMEVLVEAGGGVIDPALSEGTTPVYPLPDAALAYSAPEPAPQPANWDVWRLVEVVLALAAIGAGLAAFWLWRAGRV